MSGAIKVGDTIGMLDGGIWANGAREWRLLECPIKRIVQSKRGAKVYSDRFYPLDLEDIESNTDIMQDAQGWILTKEVVLLTSEIRAKCERWVEWANSNPEKVMPAIMS